jgi:HEPN domain-containing protein
LVYVFKSVYIKVKRSYRLAYATTMVSRASDWFRQALRDLEHAMRSLEQGDYEWACFAAHQASDKTVKALYQKLGLEVWGHSVSKLLESLPNEYKPPPELIEMAKELDKYYISTRYPNFYPEGSPMDYYTRSEAKRAIEYARKIIEFCRSKGL